MIAMGWVQLLEMSLAMESMRLWSPHSLPSPDLGRRP